MKQDAERVAGLFGQSHRLVPAPRIASILDELASESHRFSGAAIWISARLELSDTAVSVLDEAGDQGHSILVVPITAWEVGCSPLAGVQRCRCLRKHASTA